MKKRKKQLNTFESKEIKRNRNINDDTKKLFSFIIVLIVVMVCLVGLYFLNEKIEQKKNSKTSTTTSINFDDSIIMVKDVFNQKGHYYVLLYDKKDKLNGFVYDSWVTSYSNKDISLYSVDMSLKINSDFYKLDAEANKKATKYSELVINGPTLIEFNKGKIVDYITNSEKISKALNNK